MSTIDMTPEFAAGLVMAMAFVGCVLSIWAVSDCKRDIRLLSEQRENGALLLSTRMNLWMEVTRVILQVLGIAGAMLGVGIVRTTRWPLSPMFGWAIVIGVTVSVVVLAQTLLARLTRYRLASLLARQGQVFSR